MKPRKAKAKREPQGRGEAPTRWTAEHVLSEVIPEISGPRVICTSQGSGKFAAKLAEASSDLTVTCQFLDLFQAERAERREAAQTGTLRVLCAADLPDETFDTAVFPLPSGGEAELSRDLMQQAHQRLEQGGRMVVSTDNPRDRWLFEQMETMFSKVTRRSSKHGVVYMATKNQPLKKLKNFRSEFPFRDGEHLISLCTRPGVFSHRRLDGGARALINAMEIRPGDRVVDMGCGSGAVGFAAALRAENVSVVAVDSNPRAIECTEWGAQQNSLRAHQAILGASGEVLEPESSDVLLGNPPYFSRYRIAELFVRAASRALIPEGRIFLVCRQPAWFVERLTKGFHNVQCGESKNGYFVVSALKSEAQAGDPVRYGFGKRNAPPSDQAQRGS